jgi:hypothetical protein
LQLVELVASTLACPPKSATIDVSSRIYKQSPASILPQVSRPSSTWTTACTLVCLVSCVCVCVCVCVSVVSVCATATVVGAGGKTWCAVSHLPANLPANLPGAIESSRLKHCILLRDTTTADGIGTSGCITTSRCNEPMKRGDTNSRYKEPIVLRDAFLHPVCAYMHANQRIQTQRPCNARQAAVGAG